MILNDTAFSLEPASMLKKQHTLSPVSRFMKGEGFTIDTGKTTDKLQEHLKGNASLIYISRLIGKALATAGTAKVVSAKALKQLIKRHTKDLGEASFDYRSIVKDGNSFCMAVRTTESGKAEILRYFLSSDFPNLVLPPEAVSIGAGEAYLIHDEGEAFFNKTVKVHIPVQAKDETKPVKAPPKPKIASSITPEKQEKNRKARERLAEFREAVLTSKYRNQNKVDLRGLPKGPADLPEDTEIIVIGDLHDRIDNLNDILFHKQARITGDGVVFEESILDKLEKAENGQPGGAIVYINGDALHPERDFDSAYVLTTKSSVGMLDVLMELKISFPDSFHWGLGDHDHPRIECAKHIVDLETGEKMLVPQTALFRRRLQEKYGTAFLEEFIECMDLMPFRLFSPGILANHGGPPKGEYDKDDLRSTTGDQLAEEPVKEAYQPSALIWARHESLPDDEDSGGRYTMLEVDRYRATVGLPNAVYMVSHTMDFVKKTGFFAELEEGNNHFVIHSAGKTPGYASYRDGEVRFFSTDRPVPAYVHYPMKRKEPYHKESFQLDSRRDNSEQKTKVAESVKSLTEKYSFGEEEKERLLKLADGLTSNMLLYRQSGMITITVFKQGDGKEGMLIRSLDSGPGIEEPKKQFFTKYADEAHVESMDTAWEKDKEGIFQIVGRGDTKDTTLIDVVVYKKEALKKKSGSTNLGKVSSFLVKFILPFIGSFAVGALIGFYGEEFFRGEIAPILTEAKNNGIILNLWIGTLALGAMMAGVVSEEGEEGISESNIENIEFKGFRTEERQLIEELVDDENVKKRLEQVFKEGGRNYLLHGWFDMNGTFHLGAIQKAMDDIMIYANDLERQRRNTPIFNLLRAWREDTEEGCLVFNSTPNFSIARLISYLKSYELQGIELPPEQRDYMDKVCKDIILFARFLVENGLSPSLRISPEKSDAIYILKTFKDLEYNPQTLGDIATMPFFDDGKAEEERAIARDKAIKVRKSDAKRKDTIAFTKRQKEEAMHDPEGFIRYVMDTAKRALVGNVLMEFLNMNNAVFDPAVFARIFRDYYPEPDERARKAFEYFADNYVGEKHKEIFWKAYTEKNLLWSLRKVDRKALYEKLNNLETLSAAPHIQNRMIHLDIMEYYQMEQAFIPKIEIDSLKKAAKLINSWVHGDENGRKTDTISSPDEFIRAIKRINKIVTTTKFPDIDSEKLSRFRRGEGNHGQRPRLFPQGDFVEMYINSLARKVYIENKRAKIHPVLLASEVFLTIVDIQPFRDGNRRTALMIMNYMLMQNHFPPLEITPENIDEFAMMIRFVKTPEEFADFVADQIVLKQKYYKKQNEYHLTPSYETRSKHTRVFPESQEVYRNLGDELASTLKRETDPVVLTMLGKTLNKFYIGEFIRRAGLNKGDPEYLDLTRLTLVIGSEFLYTQEQYNDFKQDVIDNLPPDNRPLKIIRYNDSHEKIDSALESFRDEYDGLPEVHLGILGIGIYGHIGYNEVGAAYDSRARIVKLHRSTKSYGELEYERAFTVGIADILDANRIIVVATSDIEESRKEESEFGSKAEAVRKAIETLNVPASAVRVHRDANFMFLLDEGTASRVDISEDSSKEEISKSDEEKPEDETNTSFGINIKNLLVVIGLMTGAAILGTALKTVPGIGKIIPELGMLLFIFGMVVKSKDKASSSDEPEKEEAPKKEASQETQPLSEEDQRLAEKLKDKNVLFVSFRLSESAYDGVSLEANKWAAILDGAGARIHYYSGETEELTLPSGQEVKTETFEPAHFLYKDIDRLTQKIFIAEDVDMQELHEALNAVDSWKDKIKEHFKSYVKDNEIEYIIAENILAFPGNIPLSMAVLEVAQELDIKIIAHSHDFWWERSRFRDNVQDKRLKRMLDHLVPHGNQNVATVVIHSGQHESLEYKLSEPDVHIAPNVMDFENPPEKNEERIKEFRERFGIKETDIVLLAPVRPVPRKELKRTIDIAREMHKADKNTVKIIVTHTVSSGDEKADYLIALPNGEEKKGTYWECIKAYAYHTEGVELVDVGTHIGSPSLSGFFSLGEVYQASDAVIYTPSWEGWGNALVEAMYYKKPIILTPYEVYLTDIKPTGVQCLEVDPDITGDALPLSAEAKLILTFLSDTEKVKKMTEHNYEVGLNNFSYSRIKRIILNALRKFERTEKEYEDIREKLKERAFNRDRKMEIRTRMAVLDRIRWKSAEELTEEDYSSLRHALDLLNMDVQILEKRKKEGTIDTLAEQLYILTQAENGALENTDAPFYADSAIGSLWTGLFVHEFAHLLTDMDALSSYLKMVAEKQENENTKDEIKALASVMDRLLHENRAWSKLLAEWREIGKMSPQLAVSILESLIENIERNANFRNVAQKYLDDYKKDLAEGFLELHEYQENTDRINRESSHNLKMLRELKNNILEKRGKKELIDINRSIEEAIEVYRGDDRFTISVDMEEGMPPVMANRFEVSYIWTNLITNAIDSMVTAPKEGHKISIKTRAVEKDGEKFIEVSFSDTGSGIPEELLKERKIFQKSFTTKGKLGTGQGLHLIDRIVGHLGGAIEAESKINEGAKFITDIPIDEEAETNSTPGNQDAIAEEPALAYAEATAWEFLNNVLLAQMETDIEKEKTILAVSTSWIENYEVGSVRYNDLNPFFTNLRKFCSSRGITLVVRNDANLERGISDEMGKTENAKVIVLAGEGSVTNPDFLGNLRKSDNIFMAGIKEGAIPGEGYVCILELLTLAVMIAFDPDLVYKDPLIAWEKHGELKNVVIFDIPDADRINWSEPSIIYERQLETIRAA